MSIFSKLFGKKQTEGEETSRIGGMEDFMTLIRVYYQSVMACNIGITNINFLPDMAVFKRTLKIPTQNNKLGIAEKSRCKKMLVELYGLSDDFFKEIDGSIKKNCKNVNDVKTYLFMFQGFSNDLMMLITKCEGRIIETNQCQQDDGAAFALCKDNRRRSFSKISWRRSANESGSSTTS